jgi:GR25 family glycosyltransferase involved in LPS biosynthesis
MKTFVISAYPERRKKYDDRYTIFDAYTPKDITDEIYDNYYFRYNAKPLYRKKVISCAESHKKVLKIIIEEDLKETIIIEDDAVMDFTRIEELKGLDDFTYIGGDIVALTLNKYNDFRKNKKEDIRQSLKKGINTIDIENWRLAHACGYYIPNKEVAQRILDSIPNLNKCRAIDKEYMLLQVEKKISQFIYPAIVTLQMDEAKQGFNFSQYKLHSNQYYY